MLRASQGQTQNPKPTTTPLQKLLQITTLLIVTGIFYYSWLPNPSLSTETYLPVWLRNWGNVYYNLRTAVPFVALGWVLEMRSHLQKQPKKNSWRFNTLFATAIVGIAEAGQFFIHQRHPDLQDILFGIVGTLSGIAFYHSFLELIKKMRHAE